MEGVSTEFHLLNGGERDPAAWQLVEIHPQVFRHERGVRQPGEPSGSVFELVNPGSEQVIPWILTAEDGSVSGVRLGFDGSEDIDLPLEVLEGWSLRYDGGDRAMLLDPRHRAVSSIPVREATFRLVPGRHTVTLEAELDPPDAARARLELRPRSEPEQLGATTDRR